MYIYGLRFSGSQLRRRFKECPLKVDVGLCGGTLDLIGV